MAIDNSWGEQSEIDRLARWMIDNPEFEDRPATMLQFLGPGYLDIDYDQNPDLGKEGVIRPGVKQALIDIFGEEVNPKRISVMREALFTGGIGIGKTTMAAVALAYMVHWVCCLRDPQKFFGMMPGRRIAFMLMSTKDSQAKEVLFGDIKASIKDSEWFKNMPTPWKAKQAYDPDYRNQLRFPKEIWVIPGNSAETTFEGYNILGGILDEGDSHKVTENKDYAEVGWRTIKARVTSRFTDKQVGDHKGLLIAIGQKKAAEGFMARTQKAMEAKNEKLTREGLPPRNKVVQMAIWESFGWESYADPVTGEVAAFHYDISRRIIVPEAAALAVASPSIIRIPMSYFEDFEMDPVQALKDHAGIPPAVDDPFISATDRIDEAQDKWHERFAHRKFMPVVSRVTLPEFHEEFMAPDQIRRTVHTDIGYAAHGDAMGMAMAHIPELVEINGELKPVIVFDFLLRIKPSGGQQLMLEDFRQLLYELRDERKFRIALASYDGFQSQDSQQILQKKRFNTAEISVDRSKGPYEDLRQAIYERRIEFPRHMVYLNKGDLEMVDIAKRELSELTDTGRKIDHPSKGSKDVADAMAGCVYALMANTTFRRGAKKLLADDDDTPMLVGDRTPLTPESLGQVADSRMAPSGRVQAVLGQKYGLPALERNPFGALRRG